MRGSTAHRRATELVVGLVLVLPAAQSAWGSPCSDQQKARAQAQVQQGKRFLRARQPARAVSAFKRAYAHCPARVVQFNLALAHLVLKDRLAAATHLRRYLTRATARERSHLPAIFRRLLETVGVIKLEAKPGGKRISFWVDRAPVHSTPPEAVVFPGAHRVEVRRGGRVLARQTVTVLGGREVVWSPVIPAGVDPRAPSPPPKRASRKLHWAFFSAAALLAVGSGAALIYTGTRTLQLRADELAARELGEVERSAALAREFKRYRLVSNVLAGVTATLACTAVALGIFTRWRRAERRHRISVSAAVLPQGGYVQLRARF